MWCSCQVTSNFVCIFTSQELFGNVLVSFQMKGPLNKKMFNWLERERDRETKREDIWSAASSMHLNWGTNPQPGMSPGRELLNLPVHGTMLNQLSHTSQGYELYKLIFSKNKYIVSILEINFREFSLYFHKWPFFFSATYALAKKVYSLCNAQLWDPPFDCII